MKKYLVFAAVALFSLNSLAENITAFDAAKLREKLIDLKDHPRRTKLIVVGDLSDAKKRDFITYYEFVVAPKLEERGHLYLRYSALHGLIDSYIHASEEERDQWAGTGGEFEKVMNQVNDWTVDPKWTRILEKWAAKAEGLNGPLPDLARRMNKERQLETFAEEYKPMLDEAARLEKDYMLAVNEVPAAAGIREYRGRSTEIKRRFKAGEITFQEAQKQIKELLATKGLHFVGKQAVDKAGENLNKMAVLRSKLAKTKNVPTWAAYMLELSGQGYTPDYRGPKNQREFLRKYIEALRPLKNDFIERRIKELGLENIRSSLREQHKGLLTLPGMQQLQPYFPADKMVEIWEQTLLESGFTRKDLEQITLDISPREGKNATAAYMMPLMAPYTDEEIIDADKMDFVIEPKNSPKYHPGAIMILQNFGDAGIGDLETLFHEGGHALEALLKFKTEPTDESYGYVEVPSMTSERYARDAKVLFNKAAAHNGKKPSMEEIQTLINNEQQNEIVNLLGMAQSALFDLELWDYDYSAPGAMTYLERVKFVNDELNKLTGSLPDVETPVPFHFWQISTSHFVSGSVRNIGYTYAEIASRMMSKFLSDELENKTGSRSWYQQPLLGKLFTERFFEVGWKDQFPLNIEKITGQKFSAEQVVKEMSDELKAKDCEDNLTGERLHNIVILAK